MISPTIEPWGILNIVNLSFGASFGKVDTNLNAIVERGWGPLNRNLIPYPIILIEEKEKEDSVEGGTMLPENKRQNSTDLAIMPTFNPDLAVVPYTSEQ